jgi:glycosyltransferase involved in cell wall biosynthesis
MRVAWLGPAPAVRFGVPHAAGLILEGLAGAGAEIDCFTVADPAALPASLREREAIRFVVRRPVWPFGDWYEPPAAVTFLVSQSARAAGQARLVQSLAARHAERPYDVLYQFSQLELLAARPLVGRLPPIVLHPQVHAAGELAWHRREDALSRRCEPAARRALARATLTARAALQRADVRVARGLIVPSTAFATALGGDYVVPADRLRIAPNPIDLERFRPPPAPPPPRPVVLLFVARIAVRKGVEMIVELTRRLRDLRGQVRVRVVGGGGDWSDYRPLLADLDPAVGEYLGELDADGVAAALASAHGLLQPSHYEPFALTVGEALASGVPVVASDAVGAAEHVDRDCCRTFPAGDADAFEAAVRRLVAEAGASDGRLRALARAEAERAFAPSAVGAAVAAHLRDLAGG